MRRYARITLAAVLAVGLLTQTGCMFRRVRLENASGVTLGRQDSSEGVALDGAREGEVVLMMGAGELNVSGGAESGDLLDGDFRFSPSSLRPVFEPSTLGEVKQVVVRNEREDGLGDLGFLGGARFSNTWDIRLTEEVPLRQLSISMGAGDSEVNLRDVDVRSLSVNLGAGDATIDLTGERTHDLEGTIQAGAGALTVRVPDGIGIRIRGRLDGVGDWDAPGFKQDGNYFVNDAYATSDVKMDLTVQRGVGDVHIETD